MTPNIKHNLSPSCSSEEQINYQNVNRLLSSRFSFYSKEKTLVTSNDFEGQPVAPKIVTSLMTHPTFHLSSSDFGHNSFTFLFILKRCILKENLGSTWLPNQNTRDCILALPPPGYMILDKSVCTLISVSEEIKTTSMGIVEDLCEVFIKWEEPGYKLL